MTQYRLFRFDVPIFPNDRKLEVRSPTPAVPIFNEEARLLGFASLDSSSLDVLARCAIDPACPERLDMETGRKYWVDGNIEFRGLVGGEPTIVYVRSLVLTAREVEGRPYVTREFLA